MCGFYDAALSVGLLSDLVAAANLVAAFGFVTAPDGGCLAAAAADGTGLYDRTSAGHAGQFGCLLAFVLTLLVVIVVVIVIVVLF